MYKQSGFLLITLLLVNCSGHLEPTSNEKIMDDKFEKELVKELNKIRRAKGLHEISPQSREEGISEVNPFDAQMRRGY